MFSKKQAIVRAESKQEKEVQGLGLSGMIHIRSPRSLENFPRSIQVSRFHCVYFHIMNKGRSKHQQMMRAALGSITDHLAVRPMQATHESVGSFGNPTTCSSHRKSWQRPPLATERPVVGELLSN